MERRVLLAIFLSFLVLYAYQALFVKPTPKPAPSGGIPAAAASKAPSSSSPSPSVQSPAQVPAVSNATPVVGEGAERDIRIDTPKVAAVWTNRGGRLKSWRLKGFQDTRGEPLDIVVANLPSSQPLPFSLRVDDGAITGTLNSALYSVRGERSNDLTFEYRDDSGLQVTKEFHVDPVTYTIQYRGTVSQGGQALHPAIEWGPGLGDSDPHTGRSAVRPGGIHSVAGKVTRLASSAVATQPTYEQTFEYAGIDDHYFLSIALQPGTAKVTYTPVMVPPAAGTDAAASDLMGYAVRPSASDRPLTFYVGPKDFDTLAAIDRNLTKAIHFGMFSVIVVPLLRSLNWIQGYVGNYGWSIVLLTIFINLLLFPLRHKSVVSMRKMQEIQPETKAIQERYAKLKTTDPARQKMNQELMALYKERGVNPASGCIPILLTLPVFLAFYAMLQTAIELRGAPFIGWIHDLSVADPYYVLPVVVGVAQFATQWMTPQAGMDPTQQKMMLIMPLVLMFLFVSTPAGALLYWFVGSVWQIGQQYLTNYLIGPPNIRAVRPAAERRLKRVGAGKTEGAAREN